MKAIRVVEFGGPEVLCLVEVPAPRPGPGQAVVRLLAVGVNPVDAYLRAGSHYKPLLPFTPGMDGAGTVQSLGEGVTAFAPGDRVYLSGSVSGTYAELALCDLSHLHPLASRLSFSQGAAVSVPYATAYRALVQRARAEAGEVVLVHGGSGGVGLAAIQLARAAGMEVIATAGSDEGMALVSAQGAHHAVDHRHEGHGQEILALTGGNGVDVILEMAAHLNLGMDLPVLSRGGRVVVIGSRGPVEINPRDTMARDASILGMSLIATAPPEIARIHKALVAGLENGVLCPVIRQEMPLSEAPRAHRAIMEPGALGKIVLIP